MTRNSFEFSDLDEEVRRNIEADSFWCMTKVLDGIQDNYTFAQPGIQLKVKQLEELIQRVDKELHDHLVRHEVLYLQFAFRWMNNLVREIDCPSVNILFTCGAACGASRSISRAIHHHHTKIK